jgi:hypothetical protein
VIVNPATFVTFTTSSEAVSGSIRRVNGYEVGQPVVEATVAEVAPEVRDAVSVVETAVEE